MPRAAEATRDALLASASLLFAERDPEAVSLAQINAAAGQRNTAAVHYHFGGRDGLLDAVLAPHLADLEQRRQALLDELDDGGQDLRALAQVLVLPLAEKLDQPAGRRFLRIQARLAPRARPAGRAARKLVGLVDRVLGSWLPTPVSRVRGELVQLLLFSALAEQARRVEARRASRDDRRVFVETLVDAVHAILAAPISDHAQALTRGAA